MFTAFISGLHDRHKSSRSPPVGRCELKLKIATICLVWFISGAHNSVDGTATESHQKKDGQPFRKEHYVDSPSLPEETWRGFQQEEELLGNEEEGAGCGRDLEVCPGNRPRSLVNCTCRSLAWEKCGYDIEKVCDEHLGLQCTNNTCVGPYRLKVMMISQNSVKLIWDDFKPNDYLYEYVLLHSYHFLENPRFWQSESVGIEPQTLVSRLQANHGYFFRVATWEDPSQGKYGNISGAVFVKTKAGCLHEAKWYDVGEILKVKCEEKCRCLANGSFTCEQLCPEEKPLPEMKDPSFKCFKELVEPSGCCYKIICLPIDGSCVVNDSRVADGTVFNTACSECICGAGKLNCTKKVTCPPQPTDLPCENPIQNVTSSSSCCPPWYCLKACVHRKRTYQNGDVWRHNCDEQCACLEGSVRCRPICKTKDHVMSGNCSSASKNPEGEDGCCLVNECLPKEDPCLPISKSHSGSKMFYSPDCQICICRWNSQKVCHPLFCPDLPQLNVNPICPEPQAHPGQCCSVLYCHHPSTVSQNSIRNLTVSARGSNSMTLTFQAPINDNLLTYTHGYDVQYRRQSKVVQDDWTMLTTQPVTMEKKLASKSSTTFEVDDLEANMTYQFRVRVHLDWEMAKRLFEGGEQETVTDGQRSRIELTTDIAESVPLAETRVPPESIIPFSDTVSAKTFAQGGCTYKNQKLKLGETVQDDCNKSCECGRSGRVSCRPVVCLPQTTEKSHDDCLTAYLPIECCLSWICKPERRPFIAISQSASFELKGPPCLASQQKADVDGDVIQEEILARAEEGSSRVCRASGAMTGCVFVLVQITCYTNATTGNNANGADDHRGGNFRVHIKWTVSLKNSSALEVLTKELKIFVQDISRQFAAKDFRILIQGIPYGPSQNWYLAPLTEECDQGFKKNLSDCVETNPIIHSSPIKIKPDFRVEDITDYGAILKWQPLNQQKGQVMGNIFIAYKESRSLGKWIFSKSLNVSTVSYVLSRLLPGQEYNVKMVWQAKMFGIDDFILAAAIFSTKVTPGMQSRGMSVIVENNDFAEYFLLVTWKRLPAEVLPRLKTLELVYQGPDTRTWCSVLVPDPRVTLSHKISVIKGPGNYTVRLSIHLQNGKKIDILPTHIRVIRVEPSRSSQSSMVAGIVVSVCVVLVIAFIAVILWRRRHRRRSNSTGYENKIFGLQLSESQKSSTFQLKA